MIILRNKFFSRKNIKYKGEKQTPYNNVKVKQKITVADILKKKNANIANTAAAPVTPKQLPVIAQKQLPATIEKPKQLPATIEKPKQLPATIEKPKQLPATIEKPKVNPLPLKSPTPVPKKVPALMLNTVKGSGIGNSILEKGRKFTGKNKVTLPPQSPTPVPKKVPTPMLNTVKGSGIGNSILGKVGKFTRKNKVALTVGGLAAYGLGVNHLMNGNNDN